MSKLNNVAQRSAAIKYVIPATPGFSTVTKVIDEAGVVCDAYLTPIVGWAVDVDNVTWPITPEWVENFDHCVIVHPDGRVDDFDGAWPSVAEWVADMRERRAS